MQEQQTIIKASYLLQSKVGAGPLDEAKVKASQSVIESNSVDFVPLGMESLDRLEKVLNSAEEQQDSVNAALLREELTQPIMELKANGAMFKYDLIGGLANIMLSFLESIEEVDRDAFEIVKAHHKTLHAIIMKRMKGDGGAHGAAFQKELKQACHRYFDKRNIAPSGIFLIDA